MSNYNDYISDEQITDLEDFLCQCIEGVGKLYACYYDDGFNSFTLYFLNDIEISEGEYMIYKAFS